MIKFVFYQGFFKKRLFYFVGGWGMQKIYELTQLILHMCVQEYLFPLLLYQLHYFMNIMEVMTCKCQANKITYYTFTPPHVDAGYLKKKVLFGHSLVQCY